MAALHALQQYARHELERKPSAEHVKTTIPAKSCCWCTSPEQLITPPPFCPACEYPQQYLSARLTLENGCMAIGARRVTAFIRMYTTDTTPHALAKPNPAGPPTASVSDVFAAAPPDTRSAWPIIALLGAAAIDDVEAAGCSSRCWSRAEDAKAMDTEEDGLSDEHLDHAPHRGACTKYQCQ